MKIKVLAVVLMMICGFAHAQLVNAVAVVVNNEPITNYEIFQATQKFGGNEKRALEALIHQKLQDAQIKLLNINVTPYELNKRIEYVAKKSNLSLNELKKEIAKQGDSWANFRASIEKLIKQEKLYNSIFSDVDRKMTPEDVKNFYNENPGFFTKYKSVNATRFYSLNGNLLNALRAGAKKDVRGIDISRKTYNANELNGELNYIFASTQTNTFSPIIPTKNGGYEMYLVHSKSGAQIMPYSEAEKQAGMIYSSSQRERALKDYFDKLRARADIKFIKTQDLGKE